MAPLRVLICGGGIGGPALAFWLTRAGQHVTVVERSPTLRAKGAQVDLRAQGIKVIERMGLLDVIRTKLVDEEGVAFVDESNTPVATILANKSAQSLTAEYEIMRGDLVQILYEATKKDVTYIFGVTVDSFEQDNNGVNVHLSDGSNDRYDLLVGADGQGSRTRKAVLPRDAPDPFTRLGILVAYYIMPRTADDSKIRKSYTATKSRLMMSRTHNPTDTQAYLFLRDENPEVRLIPKASVEEQKQFFASRFRDAGWQAERFLKGMESTDDFYCQEVAQVRLDSWSKWRVVLLGDAAHCPSPLTAMGTTSAFVGAYVLAGELSRSSDDITQALANYEKTLRPFVEQLQQIKPTLIRLGFPESSWGVSLLRLVARMAALFRIPELIAYFAPTDKGGWPLPEYPEMTKSEW